MTVNPLPVTSVISGISSPACNAIGVTYSVVGTAGSSYAWTVPAGATITSGNAGPNNNQISVNFGATGGNITVTETSAASCTGSPVILPISLLGCGLDADFAGTPGKICLGSTVTFTNSTLGASGSASYSWNFGAGASPASAAGAGPHIVTYTTSGSKTISLTVIDGVTDVEIKADYITVDPVTVPGAVSGSTTVCSGTNSTTLTLENYSGNIIKWQFSTDGNNWTDIGNNTVNHTATDLITTTHFRAVVQNGVCSPVNSDEALVTVTPLVTAGISISASENNICAGTAVNFTASSTNEGATPSYQWIVNSTNVGTSSSTFSYNPANNDVVSCVLTSSASCISGSPATSNTVTMTVSPTVPASVSIVASSNPVCAGIPVTFEATSANGGIPAYQWKNKGSIIPGATGATYVTTTLSDGDIITVTMTSNLGCATPNTVTSDGITMTVNPNLPVSVSIAASATTICEGTSVTFTATPVNEGTTPSYQWKLNGANVGSNTPTYTNAALTNGNNVTCVLTSNATCATGSPATSNTINMTVNPVLPVSVSIASSPSGAICSGTSVTFTATPANGGTTPVYQWLLNGSNVGSNSTTYTSAALANGDIVTCQLTSNATCATGSPATSNTVTMAVNPNLPVSVSIAASATTICAGTSVTFTATPVNEGTTPSYQWKINGVNVGTDLPTYDNNALTNGNNVTCILTSNATCTTGNPATSNTITMAVNPVSSG